MFGIWRGSRAQLAVRINLQSPVVTQYVTLLGDMYFIRSVGLFSNARQMTDER